jgi:hypothetical protein
MHLGSWASQRASSHRQTADQYDEVNPHYGRLRASRQVVPKLERTLISLEKIDDNTANAAITDYTFNFIGAYVAFPHAAGACVDAQCLRWVKSGHARARLGPLLTLSGHHRFLLPVDDLLNDLFGKPRSNGVFAGINRDIRA